MEITREDHDGDDTTRLYHASREGSISSLNKLIQKDPLILRRVSLTTFSETPLHVSALLGHLEFSKILLTHNPKLATELDSLRRLPLHLASAEGHKGVVQELLIANPDGCLDCDQQKRIPLHYAAMRGRLDVVKELMRAKPQSIAFMDESGGTSLHLCVQYNHLECLKFLVNETGENSHFFKSGASCSIGITILRLAMMLKQTETIRYLLSLPSIREEADVVNGTLFNTREHGPRDFRSLEIQQNFMEAGMNRNIKNENEQPVLSTTSPLQPQSKSAVVGKMYNKGAGWLKETRGNLMIVTTMISTMTFQAAINPPGGVWQENAINSTIFGGQVVCSEQFECIAGTAVLGYILPDLLLEFMKYNTISFVASIAVTIFLISGFHLTNWLCMWILTMTMCVTVTFTGLTYLTGAFLVMPYNAISDKFRERYTPSGINVWVVLLVIVVAFLTFHFVAWLLKKVMNLMVQCKSWWKGTNSMFRNKSRPNMSIEDRHMVP